MPVQVRRDRPLVDFVARCHHHGAVRGGFVVVQTLIIDGHPEKPGDAERHVFGVLLLEGAANRLLAFVDAEHELCARALAARHDAHRPARRQRVKDGAPIRPFEGILEHLAPRDLVERGCDLPDQADSGVVQPTHDVR